MFELGLGRPHRPLSKCYERANVFVKLHQLGITYIGGPTCLLEFGGVRFLTDPTFDPAGGEYQSGLFTLHKRAGPGLGPEALGSFDYVLLSHDHHFDNLDHAGRNALSTAKTVITTREGASRLRGNSRGLKPWERVDLHSKQRVLRVVATPARHGPEGSDRGPVIGFVLFFEDDPHVAIYISGDTVWYEGVAEVAQRFPCQVVILHLGAAQVPKGSASLTMTAKEAVEASRAFANAVIVPLHFEDWEHFSEGYEEIAHAFAIEGLEGRLRWPQRGRRVNVDF